jgi:hypothetical protein
MDFWHTFTQVPPEEDGLFGLYNVGLTFSFGCPENNQLVNGSSITEINVEGGSIKFTGEPPFINVSGDYNTEDGSFSATGTGEVAGFSNITATFEGSLTDAGLSGQYTMGAKGGLPGGNSVTYQVSGTKADGDGEPGDTSAPGAGVSDAINAFFEVFNGAFRDGDPDPLFRLLNPAVVELYGEEACLDYLGTIIETPTSVEYLDATRVGAWNFERDGAVVPVDFVYTVQANFTANDQTTQQEFHLTIPGDDSVRWFTDCGEPIPAGGE